MEAAVHVAQPPGALRRVGMHRRMMINTDENTRPAVVLAAASGVASRSLLRRRGWNGINAT